MGQIHIEREHMKYLVLVLMELYILVRHYDPELTLNSWKMFFFGLGKFLQG